MRLFNFFLRHKIRRTGAYAFPKGVEAAQDCTVSSDPIIRVCTGGKVMIGSRVTLNSNPLGYHAGMGFPVTLTADKDGAEIIIGAESRLHGCCIHAWSKISIGRKCLVAAGAQILDAHGHVTELEYARLRGCLQDIPKPINIGDFCWIGLGALILKGVTIGEGCIVAANSVVAEGEYPPFSLIAGQPAKVIYSIPESSVLPENYPVELIAVDGINAYRY